MPKFDFPQTLFAVNQDDGDGGSFLAVSADPSDFAEKGVAIPAAEYKLVRNGVVIETTVMVK